MLTRRLNKVEPTVYTPPSNRVFVNDSSVSTPRLDGKYVTAPEKREILREVLKIPSNIWFDEKCVSNTGFQFVNGAASGGTYGSFVDYEEALKKIGEMWPVGSKATTWMGAHRTANYDPVKFGHVIVMGYQTRYVDLTYDSDHSVAGMVQPRYKAKPLLILSVSGLDGQRSLTIRFTSEKDIYLLDQEELNKLSAYAEQHPEYHVRLQDDISYARKLIDFYFREKAKGFQQAVEFYKEQSDRGLPNSGEGS